MSTTGPDPGVAGLDRCACKRGFYTLRDCENQATTTCSICSRRVCDEHLAPRIDAKVCVECAAKQEEQGPQPQHALGPALEPMYSNPTWGAVRYRHRYYGYYDYSPMWWGTYDPYWSDYDYRFYGGDDDDDDGGGFGDS